MEKQPLTPRQTLIVDAALRIIATRGSRRFTADLLAREVGLTGGALYRHFSNMDEVVDAVVDRVGDLLFQNVSHAAADPLERLRRFFYDRSRTIRANPDLSRLLLSDHLAQAGGAAQSRRLGQFKKRSRAFVVQCLNEAAAAGMIVDGMSPDAGAVVVLGSILALSHTAPRVASTVESERLFDEVWSGIERMLRRPGGGAASQTARPVRQGSTSRRSAT